MRIGLCSWSLDRRSVLRGIELAGKALDLRCVQLGFFGDAAVRQADASAIVQAANAAGVALAGSFVAFDREDYSSIHRIAATGGYASDEEYAVRLALTQEVARLTADVGCTMLVVHAGTVPDEASTVLYAKLVSRVREVADVLAAKGVRLLLETGRESAETLLGFIQAVGRENVAVNFDPANFVIYGTDEPTRAVSKLRGRIACVHMKDAVRSARPGIDYGKVAPLGIGEVGIARIVSKLRAIGHDGPLLVETGSALGGLDAIRSAADYLRSMVG